MAQAIVTKCHDGDLRRDTRGREFVSALGGAASSKNLRPRSLGPASASQSKNLEPLRTEVARRTLPHAHTPRDFWTRSVARRSGAPRSVFPVLWGVPCPIARGDGTAPFGGSALRRASRPVRVPFKSVSHGHHLLIQYALSMMSRAVAAVFSLFASFSLCEFCGWCA